MVVTFGSRIYTKGIWNFRFLVFPKVHEKHSYSSCFFSLSFFIIMIGTSFNLISHTVISIIICFRIVLGIITKKNILEHLEQLKQHVEPLVIRYIRSPH